MSRPTNLPSEVPRRLWRDGTGRCTPMADRNLTTMEERRRKEQLLQMKESLAEQGISVKKLDAGEDADGASKRGGRPRPDPTQLRRGVYVHDARSHWLDPLHKSERRQQCAAERMGVAGDLEYDSTLHVFRPSSQLSNAAARTDAERLALRALASTPQPSAEKFYSASRQRSSGTGGNNTPLPALDSSVASSSSAPQPRDAYRRPEQKPLVQVYHERLKSLDSITQQQQDAGGASSVTAHHRFTPTPGALRAHIADATSNYFGQRHAPAASQASIHAPRDSAASVLHGDATNLAGHRSSATMVAPATALPNGDDANQRRRTRSLGWKQERVDRGAFIDNRREIVAAKEECLLTTKSQRVASRAVGPYDRDADYFLRRENGVKINHSSPCRSTASTIGNWLFDYPKKA